MRRMIIVALLCALSYAQTVAKGDFCRYQDYEDAKIQEELFLGEYSRGFHVETTYCASGFCLGSGIVYSSIPYCGTFADLGVGCTTNDDCLGEGSMSRENHRHECFEGRCLIPDGSSATNYDSQHVHNRAPTVAYPYSFSPYGGHYEGCASGWILSDSIMRGEPVCGTIGPYGPGCTVDDDCVAVQQGSVQLRCSTAGECVMPYNDDGWCDDKIMPLVCDGTCSDNRCLEGSVHGLVEVATGTKCNRELNVYNGLLDIYWGDLDRIAQRIPDSGFLSCRIAWGSLSCVYTADCPESDRVDASKNNWIIYQTTEETCGDGVCSEWERGMVIPAIWDIFWDQTDLQSGVCVRDCGLCKNFCLKHNNPWTTKCNWINCGGCSDCLDMNELTTTEDPGPGYYVVEQPGYYVTYEQPSYYY